MGDPTKFQYYGLSESVLYNKTLETAIRKLFHQNIYGYTC